MHGDRRNDGILCGIDHRDRPRCLAWHRVHDIHFIALRVRSQRDRRVANAQCAVRSQVDEIENRDRIAFAVGYISKLAIAIGELRKAVLPAAHKRQHQQRCQEQGIPGFKAGSHLSESSFVLCLEQVADWQNIFATTFESLGFVEVKWLITGA